MRTWAIDEVITSSYRFGAHHLALLISFVWKKPDDPHVGDVACIASNLEGFGEGEEVLETPDAKFIDDVDAR